MTNTGAKASPRKVVTAQEPASTTKTWHRHQTHREQVTLLRGSLDTLSTCSRAVPPPCRALHSTLATLLRRDAILRRAAILRTVVIVRRGLTFY